MTAGSLECVIPSYWPFSGNSQWLLGELAAAHARLPGTMRIITGSGPAEWADHFLLDEVEIVRVGRSASVWRKSEFHRAAAREVADRATSETIVVLFDSPGQAPQWRESLPETCRLVVHFDGPVPGPGFAGSLAARRLIRALAAAHEVWVPNRRLCEQLRRGGIDPSRVIVLPDCVCGFTDGLSLRDDPARPDQVGTGSGREQIRRRRQIARVALGELRAASGCGAGNPVAFCCWPAVQPAEWTWLLRGWKAFCRLAGERHPWKPCLWIVGDAPGIQGLIEQTHQQDLEDCVFFPGTFDSLDDCLLAADWYIHPCAVDCSTVPLLLAMRSGAACIALSADEPLGGSPDDWEDGLPGVRLLDGPNSRSLADALLDLLAARAANSELPAVAGLTDTTASPVSARWAVNDYPAPHGPGRIPEGREMGRWIDRIRLLLRDSPDGPRTRSSA